MADIFQQPEFFFFVKPFKLYKIKQVLYKKKKKKVSSVMNTKIYLRCQGSNVKVTLTVVKLRSRSSVGEGKGSRHVRLRR